MKAIAYIRVSTNNQDLTRQIVKAQEYCEKQQHTFVRLIEDFGISGASTERAGYNELLSLSSDDCELLVVSEQSRLSRQEDILEVVNTIQSIILKGISIVFLDEPHKIYEGGKPLDLTNILILLMGAWKSAQERIKDKEKMQDGKMAALQKNPYAVVDASASYGYRAVPNPNSNVPKKILQRVDEEVEVIRLVFDMAFEGKTLGQISNYLNTRNIKIGGAYITTPRLSSLIHSEIYKGVRTRVSKYKQDKEPISITVHIEPIISPEVWEQVQLNISDNYKKVSTGKVNFNPLKGMLKCRCGNAMTTVKKSHFNKEIKLIYRCSCSLKRDDPNFCIYNKDEIGFDITNAVVFALLQRLSNINYVDYFLEKSKDKINEIDDEIMAKRNKIQILNKAIEALEQDSAANAERFLVTTNSTLLKALQEKQDELDITIEKEKEKINQLKSGILKLEQKQERLQLNVKKQNLSNLTDEEKADFYGKFLERIEYTSTSNQVGCYIMTFLNGGIFYVVVNKNRSFRCSCLPPKWTVNRDTGMITEYSELFPTTSFQNFNLHTEIVTKEYSILEYLKTDISKENELPVDLSFRSKKSQPY